MSVKIELHLDGDIYPLEKFSWGFSQGTNSNGMPSNKIRQKGLRISTIMVRNDEFEAWAYHNHLKKDLEIHMIPNILGTERTRIIRCFECFLIELETDYHHQSKQQTMQHMFITFGRVETNWSTAVYRENWAQEPSEANLTERQDDNEPEVIDYYITDLAGNRNPEYGVGDEIYVVIKTENMIGREFTISIPDKTKDFKYQGVILDNDRLENYVIRNNIERVKLEVIEEQNTAN